MVALPASSYVAWPDASAGRAPCQPDGGRGGSTSGDDGGSGASGLGTGFEDGTSGESGISGFTGSSGVGISRRLGMLVVLPKPLACLR